MRKFDGNDPITWIFQMEKIFDLHQVLTLQKAIIVSLSLDPDQFVWYRWLCDHKNNFIVSLSIFTNEWIAYYGGIKRNSLFIQMINHRKIGTIIEHIQQLQKFSLRVKNFPKDNLLDPFMVNLKDNIQHEGHLLEPKFLENGCYKDHHLHI